MFFVEVFVGFLVKGELLMKRFFQKSDVVFNECYDFCVDNMDMFFFYVLFDLD